MSIIKTSQFYGNVWRHNNKCWRITSSNFVAGSIVSGSNYAFTLNFPSHGCAQGDMVVVKASTISGWDGLWSVTSVINSNTLNMSGPSSFLGADSCQVAKAPSLGVATDSAQPGDALNYTSYLFESDDSGVVGGPTHRTWSDLQMCVANLVGHARSITVTDSTWITLANPTVAGVLRLWITNESNQGLSLRVNGFNMYYNWRPGNSQYKSTPIRLAPNDLVEMNSVYGSANITSIFAPYVWL